MRDGSDVVAAISFLTALPVGRRIEIRSITSREYAMFPVVGGAVGLLMA